MHQKYLIQLKYTTYVVLYSVLFFRRENPISLSTRMSSCGRERHNSANILEWGPASQPPDNTEVRQKCHGWSFPQHIIRGLHDQAVTAWDKCSWWVPRDGTLLRDGMTLCRNPEQRIEDFAQTCSESSVCKRNMICYSCKPKSLRL